MKQTILLLLTAGAALVWYRLGGGRSAAAHSASTAEPRLDAKPAHDGGGLGLPARNGVASAYVPPSDAGPAGPGRTGAFSAQDDRAAPDREADEAITPGLPDFARGA